MTKEFYLASYPRSGNTMTRLLLERHFDIDTREDYKVVLHADPNRRDTERPDLENLTAERTNIRGIAYKTHKHDAKNLPALVLVRDGRDAMVSYAHYSIDVKNAPTSFNALLHNRTGHSEWSDFYYWWVGGRSCEAPYVLITYEQLLRHSALGTAPQYLQAAMRKIGFDFEIINTTPLPGFDQYHKAKPTFFRRGIIGGWKDEMSKEVEEYFWRTNGAAMTFMGYER